MAGVKKAPTKGGLFQAWYTDYTGKRRYFTTQTRSEAKKESQRLESEHSLVRKGIRPVPSSADQHRHRCVKEVVQEYLDWGAAQGGRKGMPWSPKHRSNRKAQLERWVKTLGLQSLADLNGILPRIEKGLRQLQADGKTGKTIANNAESLAAFCDWSVQRGYLADDPLKALAAFDTTPQIKRRAITPAEIRQLLTVCNESRHLLYETAILSGLRANELRHLSVDHLDEEGLHLEAVWTKNHEAGFQPLPRDLQPDGASPPALSGRLPAWSEQKYAS
jgi:hypothetical protein